MNKNNNDDSTMTTTEKLTRATSVWERVKIIINHDTEGQPTWRKPFIAASFIGKFILFVSSPPLAFLIWIGGAGGTDAINLAVTILAGALLLLGVALLPFGFYSYSASPTALSVKRCLIITSTLSRRCPTTAPSPSNRWGGLDTPSG